MTRRRSRRFFGGSFPEYKRKVHILRSNGSDHVTRTMCGMADSERVLITTNKHEVSCLLCQKSLIKRGLARQSDFRSPSIDPPMAHPEPTKRPEKTKRIKTQVFENDTGNDKYFDSYLTRIGVK